MSGDGARFAFGKNWTDFLGRVDHSYVEAASASLRQLLGDEPLAGRTFLDIGCGSGLSSLAAHLAGAEVTSFDYDPASVECARTLKERFGRGDGPAWAVMQGSALDEAFIASLGVFDVVHAWGVLHHTGDMDRAIELSCRCVAPDGLLVLAIYNDQGGPSRRWAAVKRFYHRLPAALRPVYVAGIASLFEAKFALARIARGQNPSPRAQWRAKKADRGMSPWYDWVDWIGGWPFEVATPDRIINERIAGGFQLQFLKTVGCGWGCNEYRLRRAAGER